MKPYPAPAPVGRREAFLLLVPGPALWLRAALSRGPTTFTKTQQLLLINKHIDHTDMGCQGLNS